MFKTLKKKLTVQEGSKCLLIYDYSISFSANNKLQGWTHTQDHRANFNHFQRIKTKVSVYNVVDIDKKRITRKPPY